VTQQFCSKNLPNRGILAEHGGENSFGHQVRQHFQGVMPFAPVHLIGSHPDHVGEAQPGMHRLYVGAEHQTHPQAVLAKDLAGPLHGLHPHQDQGEGLELLGEALAAPLQQRGQRYNLPPMLRRPHGSTQTITHSLLRMLRCRHCLRSTWS